MSLNPLTITWEAVYSSTHAGGEEVYREREGGLYANIDRNRLKSFRLVAPGEVIFEAPMSHGRTGHNLLYRRRTQHNSARGTQVWFLVGFVPMGPFASIDARTGEVTISPRLFPGAGRFGEVQAIPEAGELWDGSLAHSTDAHLRREVIILPTGMQISTPHLNDGRHGRKGQ